MENVNVVFDTNAYRNLTFGLTGQQTKELFDKVRGEETSRKITSVLSAITLMELLAHLADKADSGYHHCKIATIGAYHHVQQEDSFRLLPDPELLLQQMLFRRIDKQQEEINLMLGQIAYAIHLGPADDKIMEFDSQLQFVKNVVEQHEKDFIDDMLLTVNFLDESAKNWRLFENDKVTRNKFISYLNTNNAINILSQALVLRTIDNLKIQTLSEDDFINMTKEVSRVFHTPLNLYINIMRRMATSGFDMTNLKKKRWNTIWDIYLLFCISDENLQGKETIFITEENWLHQICIDIGKPHKIMKLSDYKLLLGL